MINKPPAFKGLNIRIPIIIPIKGRGFINQGSTLCRRSGSYSPSKCNTKDMLNVQSCEP